MVRVEFLGPIGKAPIEIEARTLVEVSNHLKADASLNQWLEKSAVAVNDVMVSDLNLVLNEGDKISILPPVCGG